MLIGFDTSLEETDYYRHHREITLSVNKKNQIDLKKTRNKQLGSETRSQQ